MADCSELSKLITEMAMTIAQGPNIQNLDDVIAEMQTHFPDLPRQGIIEAIVEATTRQARQADDLSKKLSVIKRQAKMEKGLKDKIAELEQFLSTGTLPERIVRAGMEATYTMDQLKAIRDGLKKQLAQSDPAQRTKVEKQIADLEEKIKSGDIMPKIKAEKPAPSKELEKALYKRDLLKDEIRTRIYDLKPKSTFSNIVESVNVTRAVMTTGEMSLTLRQGIMMLGHPVKLVEFTGQAFKALADPLYTHKVNRELLERDLAAVGYRAKLHLSPIDGTTRLRDMEEQFMGHWVQKVPILKQFARAGTTYINLVRAFYFDSMYHSVGRSGELTQAEAEILGNFVNVATGRGNLGAAEAAMPILSNIFFSARYQVSRFQLIMGQPLWHQAGKGSARVRQAIAKEYARSLIGLALFYAMGALWGDIEKNPRSADFMKIRIGKTRIDPLAGLSQITVLMTRLITGEIKTTTKGEVIPIRGEKVPYGGTTVPDVLQRFIRGKLSPLLALPFDIAAGENIVGEKVDAQYLVTNYGVPITWGDIYDAMKEQGVEEGLIMSLLSFFGVGLQTYEDKKQTTRRRSSARR